MSEHKLMRPENVESARVFARDYFPVGVSEEQYVLDTCEQLIPDLLSHTAAQAAEIDRLRAEGERYRALRGLAIQHTEVVVCIENHADDDEAPEYEWSIDLGSTGESIGSGGTCDAAIDNARANAEGR